jgi:hypothetical protein
LSVIPRSFFDDGLLLTLNSVVRTVKQIEAFQQPSGIPVRKFASNPADVLRIRRDPRFAEIGKFF